LRHPAAALTAALRLLCDDSTLYIAKSNGIGENIEPIVPHLTSCCRPPYWGQPLIAQVLFAIAVVIALALWWRHGDKQRHSVRDVKRPSDNYHCVELRYRRDACDAVKRIGAKRFLPGEAPGIPVLGCDAGRCSCRYVHHEDRRDSDRRNPVAQRANQPPASAGGERRSMRDRRKPAKTPIRPKMGR
jgi:hypothetical protein